MSDKELIEIREYLKDNFSKVAEWVAENSDYLNEKIDEETENTINNNDLKVLQMIKKDIESKEKVKENGN